MGIVELLLVGIALAMDAFAAAICQGLGMAKIDLKKALFIALMFGAFQALMPFIGYVVAGTFASYITNIDHWIAFILLVLLGINLIKEAFEKEEEVKEKNRKMKIRVAESHQSSDGIYMVSCVAENFLSIRTYEYFTEKVIDVVLHNENGNWKAFTCNESNWGSK